MARPGQKGPCLLCSLREFARWTLESSNKRAFATTSTRCRSRPTERIAKGRWKESIISPLGPGRRKSPRRSGGFSFDRKNPGELVLGLEGKGIIPAAQLELQFLKRTLQDGKTPTGADSSYADLDPKLQYFDTFEKKVTKCIEDGEGKIGGTASEGPLGMSLLQAFANSGRTGLRKALLFAYVDHILDSRQMRGMGLSIPKHLDLRYPTEWYLCARSMQREIHLHVGPTNSGKTYHALKRLEDAGSGIYAGPLRLLAHEVYSRFTNKGMSCDLITGDDVRRANPEAEAPLSSHTVEMVDCGKTVDVAVIDEIQMIANEERGWAWTRALLGTMAKELHLCGETRVVPLIRELAASMGDTLHIHHYDRLNPLKAMNKSLQGNLQGLRRGDCIVSFSVLGIHAMKKQVEVDTGRRVAIIYGSLPPEIRAQQAALFNDPNNDYDFLVASDAIGMGLNLSIKRIIFETIWKYNGQRMAKLSVSQIKQIAGRAGRYRTADQNTQGDSKETKIIDSQDSRLVSFKGSVKQSNVGLVTCLDERDLADIQTALNSEPDPIKAAGLQPPVEFIDAFAKMLPLGTPLEYMLQRLNDEAKIHSRYFLCDTKDGSHVAACLDGIQELDIVQRCIFVASPADTRTESGRHVIKALARHVANRAAVTITDVEEIPLDVLDLPLSEDREYLLKLELLHKSLILYLWLSYRFSNIFLDREMAIEAKSMVEEKINTTLLAFSANPKLRTKLLQRRQIIPSEDALGVTSEDSRDEAVKLEATGLVEEELSDSVNALSTLSGGWEGRRGSEGFHPNAEELEIRQPSAAQP